MILKLRVLVYVVSAKSSFLFYKYFLAFAIGPECYRIDELRQQAWINTYRLVGKLGEQTDKHNIRSKVVAKAEYGHVTRHMLQKLLSRIRAQYKRAAFKLASVDLQSQEAFEIARKGAPRPQILDSPIVYNAFITHFQTPYFGLQLQVTGETDYFLRYRYFNACFCYRN